MHINKAIQLVSSAAVEVTFRTMHSDSPPGEDDDHGEDAIIVPVTSFPHPHRLSTIIEEDEEVVDDSLRPDIGWEDQDDTSCAETIRPSSTLAHFGPVNDAGSDAQLGCMSQARTSRLTAQCRSRRFRFGLRVYLFQLETVRHPTLHRCLFSILFRFRWCMTSDFLLGA